MLDYDALRGIESEDLLLFSPPRFRQDGGVNRQGLRQRIIASPIAPLAAMPIRMRHVARYNAHVLGQSARWLVRSREHTNFTYDLTPLNREHLAWWVATVADISVTEARGHMAEVEQDENLSAHVLAATAASDRRRLADMRVGLAKRIGWYALVRATRPEHVVETGTDKGLGSVVFAAALLANGTGRLTTIDTDPDSGYLIQPPYAEVIDRLVGDSVTELGRLAVPVDLFLHDSLHTFEHETAEYETAAARLSAGALVLSDNGHVTDALPRWAELTGRRFLFFHEQPGDHWYPGGGIGAAWGKSAQ